MQGIPQGQNPQHSSGGGLQKPSLSWQSPGPAHKPGQGSSDKFKAPMQAPLKLNGDKSSTGTYVVIFIGGLIVGGLLGALFTGQRSTPGTSSTATTTDTSLGAGEVVVNSPQNAGLSVAVAKVNVTKPTWVVIYDNNAGVPGLALGATLFYPVSMGGETSGTISLLRNTFAGKTYLVGGRLDNGDHKLTFKDDVAVVDSNDKPILSVLTVQ